MKRFILQTILLFVTLSLFAQEHRLAILDFTDRNGEINKENLASASHMAEVAGMPFSITINVEEAVNFPFILITSSLREETTSENEITLLHNYVRDGGILIAPFIKSELYFDLFGISYSKYESNRYLLTWDLETASPELKWINDANEIELPLADTAYYKSIYTRGYTTSVSQALAHFEDEAAAITVNNFGAGKAYALGFELRDLVMRNLLNKDYNANRMYSNGFEPTTDVILLFLRAIYTENQPVAIYKHTSPKNSTSALLITHDVDSQTGVDSMYYFSEWEARNNIQAHYFITTRYFSDGLMGDFYDEAGYGKMKQLLLDGHQIGSHSVGHFPDFANRTLFPQTTIGNTKESYQPSNHDGVTSGGSLTAELEVSRDLLNADIGAHVRSFRAGHLAFNLRLINEMDVLGYSFNSTNSANDVLTNFPYQQRTNSAFSGVPSAVYEIPMTMSDASKSIKLTEETIDEVVENWLGILEKNNDNNAPTVLLIHPNRGWKLQTLENLMALKPSSVIPFEFDAFGDFWLERKALDFNYTFHQDTLQIDLVSEHAVSENQSLIITGGKAIAHILVYNQAGEKLEFQSFDWNENDLLISSFQTEDDTDPEIVKDLHSLAIWDICDLLGETDKENLVSATHMADVAGIPYSVTTSLDEAMTMDFVLITSQIEVETLSIDQINQLKDYVANGGILMAPFIKNTLLFDLFGIASTKLDKYRYTLSWVDNPQFFELKWMDDPMEKTIPLADADYYRSIYTRGYTLASAQALAYFEDEKVAVCKNTYGNGAAYAFGVEWKDVVLRNLLNKDYDSQRTYSNGFEPATDAFLLALRAIFTGNQAVSVYKHTSPGESTATLLITHDVDSRTIIDTMHYFSNWEFLQELSAHYFVTTHYFKDTYMSAYYEESKFDKIKELIERNHTVGSHSVGHFPDFSKTSVFPTGEPGNTKENYNPYYNGSYTEGGTVYGEVEVSRDLLNNDIHANVRSYRSGAMAFNTHLANVLEDMDYSFNSSESANNVLTNFPFYQRTNKSFSGTPLKLLEIPMTLTDVSSHLKLESTNIDEVVAAWIDVIEKNNRNNAPSVLLISPNRGWKLEALQKLLLGIPEGVITYNFEDYGDYWLDRNALDFDYYIDHGILNVEVNSGVLAQDLSFVVENGSMLNQIKVKDSDGMDVAFHVKNWNTNDLLITFGENNLREKHSAKIDVPQLIEESKFNLFPNPTQSFVNLLFDVEAKAAYRVWITDINGRVLFEFEGIANEGATMHRLDLSGYKAGMYLVNLQSDSASETKKLFVTE
ncbi:MAG: T9SS type A sorting domain-containing protein [Bacteroidales bacterium]|nr:T9SS type A sorting domain-containing protein [Bacteroidales bacterium]